MDKGATFRSIILVLVAGAIATAGWVAFASHKLASLEASWQLLGSAVTYVQPYYEGMVSHILAGFAVAFVLFNYNAVLAFVRRSLTSTDALVIGPWYVYRYTKTLGKPMLLKDLWTVRRNFSRRYVVDIIPYRNTRRNAYKGRVIYNERDRFDILLEGTDHKEQSLICFKTRIPTSGDTRMLGLAVGDDADYVLSSRIYMASRKDLPLEYVHAVLDDATEAMKTDSKDQLIQLTTKLSLEAFARNTLPTDVIFEQGTPLPSVVHRLRAWCASVGVWARGRALLQRS